MTVGFFNGESRQPSGQQMSQAQMQAIANERLQEFGNNVDRYIEKSGIQFPREIRGNIPAMCQWMIQNGKVPERNLRIAQPLINRLFPRR